MGRLHADMDVFVSDDSAMTSWQLTLHAPDGKGLLYDGGSWRLLVDFSETYPQTAPNSSSLRLSST
jgi:ubiquitin-protein ligase